MIIGKCPVCGADMRVGSDMTNADRIRSMTDEELADVIAEGFCSGRLDKCNNYKSCTDCTLDWLREEVEA